jgi:hypothetical protein
MHGQRILGQLLQMFSDFISVHRAPNALQKPQNYQGARPSVELFLKLAICGFGVQFDSSLGRLLTTVMY